MSNITEITPQFDTEAERAAWMTRRVLQKVWELNDWIEQQLSAEEMEYVRAATLRQMERDAKRLKSEAIDLLRIDNFQASRSRKGPNNAA